MCMDKPYKGIRGQQIARKVVVEGVRPNVPTHVPTALQDIMPRMSLVRTSRGMMSLLTGVVLTLGILRKFLSGPKTTTLLIIVSLA